MQNNKRVLKEIKELNEDLKYNEDSFIKEIIIKDEKTFKEINVAFSGPKNSPYEQGVFLISINFNIEHPFKAPLVKFLTKTLHPNVGNDGSICVDILRENWNPSLTILKIIKQLHLLLIDPNPDSPLNREIADIYKKDKDKYSEEIKKFIKENNYKINN